MNDGHSHGQPYSSGTVSTYEALQTRFGAPGGAQDIVGDYYLTLLAELAKITEYQWRQASTRGLVRGFFLTGPPGVGKTTLAKRLGYELGLRFPRQAGRDGVATVVLDGSEIARSKYGESERRIREIFAAAGDGLGTPGQRVVLVFDDVESILMARGSQHAKEWHFSQDSVFFHAMDDLDTSRTAVVLTSNRPDLVDEAIRDRFLEYDVSYPGADVLTRLALARVAQLDLSESQRDAVTAAIETAIDTGALRSLRDAERLVLQHVVAVLLGTESLARRGS